MKKKQRNHNKRESSLNFCPHLARNLNFFRASLRFSFSYCSSKISHSLSIAITTLTKVKIVRRSVSIQINEFLLMWAVSTIPFFVLLFMTFKVKRRKSQFWVAGLEKYCQWPKSNYTTLVRSRVQSDIASDLLALLKVPSVQWTSVNKTHRLITPVFLGHVIK